MGTARTISVSKNRIEGTLSFESGYVGKHHSSADITDGEDMRHVRPHVTVRDNSLGGEFHTGCGKIQTANCRPAAYRHQDFVGNNLELLVLLEIFHHEPAVISFRYRLHCGRSLYGNTSLSQSLLEPLGQVSVETRKYILAELHDGHLRAETLEDGSEFQSDDPGANNTEFLRNIVERKNLP